MDILAKEINEPIEGLYRVCEKLCGTGFLPLHQFVDGERLNLNDIVEELEIIISVLRNIERECAYG